MKKITLMCSLAFAASLTAFAQTGTKITSLEQLSNEKCYTIISADASRGTWCYDENNPNQLTSTTVTKDAIDTSDPNQQFAFLKSSKGNYYIYSVGAKKFFSSGNNSVSLINPIIDAKAYATFLSSTHPDNANFPWVVAINGNQLNLCTANDGRGVVFYNNHPEDAGNSISITEAGTFDDASEAIDKINKFETYYTEENIALTTEANKYLNIPRDAVGAYPKDLWDNLNAACGNDGIADIYDVANTNFETALNAIKASSPREVAFSNDKVYTIQNIVAGNGFLCSKEESGVSHIFSSTKNSNLTTVQNSEKWQVYTENSHTYLYNQGTKTYARYDANANKWNLSKIPTYIEIQNNTEKGIGAFWIKDLETSGINPYMHCNNGNSETGIVGWNTDAQASYFYFIETTDEAESISNIEITKAKEEAQAILDGLNPEYENYIGTYTSEYIQKIQNAINDANATVESIQQAVNEGKKNRLMPQSNEYYFILNTMVFDDGGIKTIFENPDGTNVAWHTVNYSAAELWQLEQEEGGDGDYYIKSANTGKYIKLGLGAHSGTIETEKYRPFRLIEQENTYTYGLQSFNEENTDKATLMLSKSNEGFGQCATSDLSSGDYIGTYNAFGTTLPTKWNIVKATQIKLKIEESGYATAWFPFAVTIPSSGVEVYYVSGIQGNKAILKTVENTIPAQSAVILKGNQGTYSFEIATDQSAPSISDNNLEGTSIATTIESGVEAYVLANPADGQGVGFYKLNNTDRTIAANKAYLTVAGSAGIKAFTFDFGGTTGIENTEAAVTETEEYYDLQGRRVASPTKGIYVTKSGKKVLFTK